MPRARLDLSVEAARERLIQRIQPLSPISRSLTSSLGLTIPDAFFAPVDLPRYTNSAMDGYAVRSADTATASATTPIRLTVIGALEAGDAWSEAISKSETVRIGTGAAVPVDCDAVIPTERVTESRGAITVTESIESGKNVRLRGEDIRAGSLAIPAGATLRPQEIGLLAALGAETVTAIPAPVVTILSVGPELFPGGRPASVFDANGPMLAAQVEAAGGTVGRIERCTGERETLAELMSELAADADLIVTSGGVSDSSADSMADILAGKIHAELWNVRLRPGKHLGFGMLDGRFVLAVPGNPVAAFVTFELFVRLAIDRMMGRSVQSSLSNARAETLLLGGRGRTDALRGRAWIDDTGQLRVEPAENRGSGVLSSLPDANCLIILPEEVDRIEPGKLVSIRWVGYQ